VKKLSRPEDHDFDTMLVWVADDGAWAILHLKDGRVVEKLWIPQAG